MDNLSPYLKEQYAAQKEQELAQLKNAYSKNLQALDEKSASVPAQYEAAKNEAAVQNAIAKKNFNEQAAATGLNTGTSGQAELARSNAYMSALSKLNRSEAETQQALERDRLSLQTDYENAIAAQAAANEAALQSALYQEMIRQQNAQQAQKEYEYQLSRDAIADAQWQKQFDEAVRQYDQDYDFTMKKYMDAINASYAGGSSGSGGSGSGGYDTHGYTTEEIKRLQQNAKIDVDGIWGPQTQAAFEAGYTKDGMPNSAESWAVKEAKRNGGDTVESQLRYLESMRVRGQISDSQLEVYAKELLGINQ